MGHSYQLIYAYICVYAYVLNNIFSPSQNNIKLCKLLSGK